MPRVTILLAVSLMLTIGCSPDDDASAVAVATATRTEAVATTQAPSTDRLVLAPPQHAPQMQAPQMQAPQMKAPLVKALSGEPVATCGVPRHRPLWRNALTSVANGLGLDSDTRLALYKALPNGVSRFLRR